MSDNAPKTITYATASEPMGKYLLERRAAILRRALISQLYHRRRERFFAIWERLTKGLALGLSTAAATKVLPAEFLGAALAAIGITSALSLVFAWSELARRHGELAAAFIALQADMARVGERHFSEDDTKRWDAECIALGAKEPTQMTALVVMVEHQVAVAEGHPNHIALPPFWKRWTAHFIDWPVAATA